MKLPNRVAIVAAFASMLLGASPAFAQYSRLQVLLPGESPAPGTITGKTGVPTSQTVGVPFLVVVRACDSSWNTVTSITNTILLDSTDESADLPGASALSNGTTSLSVTMNADGSFTVSADDQSDGTIPTATSAPVTVYSLAGFEFDRITQKNQYAGVDMATNLEAVDPSGNRVTGFNGQVRLREITSFGEGRIEPSIVTLTNGFWAGTVKNYRADETSINRGNVNMEAELIADPSIDGTSDPFTVHPGPFHRVQIVVPGQLPAPGTVNGLTGSPATQGAGQTFTVEVYATDDYWNPLPAADNVRITSSDPGANTPLTGTLTNGYRTFTVSLGTVGTQTLSVADLTNGSIVGMTSAGIPVTNSTAHHFVIDPFTTPVDAGDNVAVQIRATDIGGNTIPDYAGNALIIPNTGPGSMSPEMIVFVNGIWNGNMVFRGAGGAVSFTVSDFASPPHTGNSGSFLVNPGPFTGMQVLLDGQTPQGGTATGYTGAPTDQQAGTAFQIRVRAVDAYWNRVSGINDRVGLSSSDPFAGMPAEITLVNGERLQAVTLFKGGFQNITATDLDNGSITANTSADVEVLPGPYSRIVLIAPGEHVAPGSAEGRAGAATDQSINFAFTVTVYATDAWFNPLIGTSDLIRLSSGDPLAQLPSDTPMTDGIAQMSMRLSTGGFQQITATNVSQPSMPSSTTQVRAISSGFHLEAEVVPTAVAAGEAFTLTVKVTNDAGSVIQEINSFVTVTVQNASTQSPGRGTLLNTEFQLLQGQRSIQETYTFAEPIVLVVTDDAGNAPAVTDVITVSPGPPHHVSLSSNPPWVRGNKHATVEARVLDFYENGVPTRPVGFELLSGAGVLTPIDIETDASGLSRADYLSPRTPQIARIRATSGLLSAEFDLETALVDPGQGGGYITNYPNPFHPDEAPTTIAYKLAADARVKMKIYSLSGAEVFEQVIAQGDLGGREGLNEYQWNGRNGKGEPVASGGYVLIAEADRNGETIHVMRRRIAVVR
jgi:predicted RNA-binding protein with TRAM domain